LDELNETELATILVEQTPRQLLVTIRSHLSSVADSEFTKLPLREALSGKSIPDGMEDSLIIELSPEQMGEVLAANLSTDALKDVIDELILKPIIEESWTFRESLLDRGSIEAWVEENAPEAELDWRMWLNGGFVNGSLSRTPAIAGIRPALLGSLWLMGLTIVFAFPLGIGAAIYLEEYASDTWFNRVIETNIRNLAGVPSIIYGMLGLTIFVRIAGDMTAGRTILSASLTLALLILPIIIISGQEALRAVPWTIREASYGLGATKWQTIYRQVLPAATPGIMTGTILALSRAVGETAPLIVVGAATFISSDPSGPTSAFTALPILIYNWTSQPDPQFQNTAAAAIIVLLIVLLSMNSVAIVVRNRTSNRS
jgi:phosphate transport system permease protein